MMDLKLGNLLLEMRKNYTEQPVFLFTEKGETAKPVMYPDFLADLDENVKKAENMKPERDRNGSLLITGRENPYSDEPGYK